MNNITPSRPIKGFMPLHRQMGFVFPNQIANTDPNEVNKTSVTSTIAHEIGHGIFELEHPWEELNYPKTTPATNWLMDYDQGTKLPYMHWQKMSHPKFGLYVFQDDENGELASQVQTTERNFGEFSMQENAESTIFYVDGDVLSTGWKLTFKSQNVIKIGDNKFEVNENSGKSTLKLYYSVLTKRPVLIYDDVTVDTYKQSNGNYKFPAAKYYTETEKYTVEVFKYDFADADVIKLKNNLKNLSKLQKTALLKLIFSAPWDEIIDLCAGSNCYDILNKQYSETEWNSIILLINQKKQAIQNISYLATNQQLLIIKNLILSEANKNNICRLNLNNALNKNSFTTDLYDIIYEGLQGQRKVFKVKLKNSYLQPNVSKIFFIKFLATEELINGSNISFEISIPNKNETIEINNFPKGIHPSVALSNAIGQTVFAVAFTMTGVGAIAEIGISATLLSNFVANKGKDCVKGVLFDIGIQFLTNEILKKFDQDPIDFSYSSLPVSCVSAYLPDTSTLACTSGMFTSLGNDIIYNFNQTDQSKVLKFNVIVDNLAVECLQNVCINAVLKFSISKLPAIKKALKWFSINKLITKTISKDHKKIVGEILENFSSKIKEGVLAEIINTTTEDTGIILNQIKNHLDTGGKIEKIDQIIYLIDADNKKMSKFVGGKWVNGAGNLPSLIRQLVSKPSFKPLRTIWSKQNKTTTFIGKWDELVNGQQNGLQKVYGELSQSDLNIYMQSGKFDHPGGFNMLSIDNFPVKQAEYAQKLSAGQINSSWSFEDYIWEAYNKPWLESALQRGDEIIIWSDPINSRTGFYKRELDFIQTKASQYGYDYNTGISSGAFSK